MSNCKHCRSKAFRSVVLESSAAKLLLYCSACDQSYVAPDRRGTILGNRRYHPCSKERIHSLKEVGVGDLIQYTTADGGEESSVRHALCIEVDRMMSQICVVERNSPLESGNLTIRKKLISDIRTLSEICVFRYMPLDCLQLHNTLLRARASLQNHRSREETLSEEEFVNGLKTGREQQVTISCKGRLPALSWRRSDPPWIKKCSKLCAGTAHH